MRDRPYLVPEPGPEEEIDFDLIARGRDRGGAPTNLTTEELLERKDHWRRLKEKLEDAGIEITPWRAFHEGLMPEELAKPLREALERAREGERRRQPTKAKIWGDWMVIGCVVRGVGRWRHGMVGVVDEIKEEGGKVFAIVRFDDDRFAFEPGELEPHEQKGK